MALVGQIVRSGLGNPGAAANLHVAYQYRTAAGVACHIITVNLREPQVKVTLTVAQGNFPHANESFASMVGRTKPTAAINGTCFDKQTLKPIGDLVINGRVVHRGLMGTALAITAHNRAVIRRVSWGHAEDWSAYETVVACGPTLIRDGQIDLRPAEEGFRDPHVLGAGVRSAGGLTAAGKLLLVSVPRAVTLRKLAEVMQALGCEQALNLEGGASMAMYYRGRTILSPGRKLTNVLLVYE
jgi:exopolysaccharide biosynthesis protein